LSLPVLVRVKHSATIAQCIIQSYYLIYAIYVLNRSPYIEH